MKNLDKKYLSLQFSLKVYQKSASEFQSFFEDIMQKAFPDFHKIKPYGREGDGGNDGYVPSKGAYYQVYAPIDPHEKEATAARKYLHDFKVLKETWDSISQIKEFNFVFNDKYSGTTIELEKVQAKLCEENPNIVFKIFTPVQLEQIFFMLSNDQICSLGFDIDSSNVTDILHENITDLEIELDKENIIFVSKALEKLKEVIINQNNEDLLLDYEILESRTLQKAEMVEAAKRNYQLIFKRYPNDLRAPLFLAEIYLDSEKFADNEELLLKAEQLDSSSWLLQIQTLVRDIRLGHKIDISNIREQDFPHEARMKSNFYRLYGMVLNRLEDHGRADSFIERAIQLNPNRFANYQAKLSILTERLLLKCFNSHECEEDARNLFNEIATAERIYNNWGASALRSSVLLNFTKLHVYLIQENYPDFEKTAKDTFELVLKCYFDWQIDIIITELIHHIELPDIALHRLLDYLRHVEKPISMKLAKNILLQFILKDNLFTAGKKFFQEIDSADILILIDNIEHQDYDNALIFLMKDVRFAVDFALHSRNLPDLRMKIVQELPDGEGIQKDKILLLLNYDMGDTASAFEILKKLDIPALTYAEYKLIYKVAIDKRAWDFVVVISEKLLLHEKDKRAILYIKIQMQDANFNLERYPETIELGKALLSDIEGLSLLSDSDKEMLLVKTVLALFKRGEFIDAQKLVERNGTFLVTFENQIFIGVEAFLKNNDSLNAQSAIIEAAKKLGRPSPEQYGTLYLVFVRLGNLTNISTNSLMTVQQNCFVKLKNVARWFFIGEENELDATKVNESNPNYSLFIGKKLHETISFDNPYRTEKDEGEIEKIFFLNDYIVWQSYHNAQQLTKERRWDKVEVIDVPKTDTSIDTKYIVAHFEDELRRKGEFFDYYCSKRLPFAMLAKAEGGMINAIGRIVNSGKGFVNLSDGTQVNLDKQEIVARNIIKGQPFYIDGTSAFVLTETGLIDKIHNFLPNMKVPQSVISLLLEIQDRFTYVPGLSGHMSYSRGQIRFSPFDRAKSEVTRNNFVRSIHLFESAQERIGFISAANKLNCFSEQEIFPSLSDACILAQKERFPILTDDYLYLKINSLETKKDEPEYCSSFALLKVFYEEKIVNFDDYLDFFHYLCGYRFRFLPITRHDLEKAIFGDKVIAFLRPEYLRKFNFRLTLSEDYGVSPINAFSVIANFLVKIIIDNSIPPEMAEKIFTETVFTLPATIAKRSLWERLPMVCERVIKDHHQLVISTLQMQKKLDTLSRIIQAWSSTINIF
jgi:hypothetical protein